MSRLHVASVAEAPSSRPCARISARRHSLDPRRYPPFKELAEGLIEDYYAAEFELGLDAMLDRN